MSYGDFGNFKTVCFVRIRFDIGIRDIDYIIGTSYWRRDGVYSSVQKIIQGRQMISEYEFVTSTCLRYRCSEDETYRTQIHLDIELTNITTLTDLYTILCVQPGKWPAPVVNEDIGVK